MEPIHAKITSDIKPENNLAFKSESFKDKRYVQSESQNRARLI